MRRLRIPHPDISRSEKSYLDVDYSSGTTLTVLNNFGFDTNDIAIVGQPGEEKTESQSVASQSGNFTITLNSALKFDHNKSIVVFRFEYDQYEISRYRAGAWTLISTSNIQWDKRETIYVDDDGVSTDSYRYRFLNSASAAVSDYSPTIPATGYTRNQAGYIIKEVRQITGDNDRRIIKTDDELIRQINRCQEIVFSKREDWWFLHKTADAITTIADTKKYGLATAASDLNYIDTVLYTFNDGTTNVTYHLSNKTRIEHDYDVRDNTLSSDDYPESYTILPPDTNDAVGYIELNKPSETTNGSITIRYYKEMAEIDTVADSTDIPIPSIVEDFLFEYVYTIKGDEARTQKYKERFWGPEPGQQARFNEPTGIRLLELSQGNKSRAVGQPESMKKFRGRKPMKRLFGDYAVNRDDIVEKYW